MKLLLLGASGLVGSHVLAQVLASPRVDAIVAPARRALPAHAKLHAPIVDFDALPPDAAWWQADAAVCTLGTTLKRAGSREAFRRVDHDYVLAAARLALAHGTRSFALNSALGADATSRVFYNRVKGEIESALERAGFESLTFVRPGLIGGERDEVRTGERVATVVLNAFGALLPRRYRINPAANIARELLDAALSSQPGTHVVEADRMA